MTETPRPWRYKHHPSNRSARSLLEAAAHRLAISNSCENANPGLCIGCRERNAELIAQITKLIEDQDA